MAYTVTGLPNYVDQTSTDLLFGCVFKGKTQETIQYMTGVKYQKALQLMVNDFSFQTADCEFTPNGTSTFSQRTMTVGSIKIQEEFCPKDLERKWTQHELQPGSHQTKLPFEEAMMKNIVDLIKAKNETAIWQGSTASGNADLNKFDVFLRILATSGGYVSGNTIGATGITAANIIAVVDAVVASIPNCVYDKDSVRIFMGVDLWRMYQAAITKANLFHYTRDGVEQDGYAVGTNIKIVAVQGLNGTNKIVAFDLNNAFIGPDLSDDEDKIELWYSQDARKFRFSIEYKLGTQFAYPSEVVLFSL